jgi:hypothetical protein
MSKITENGWLPIETAPKDGTLLLLLIKETEISKDSLDDVFTGDYSRTIGINNLDNDEQDRWQIVGWDWCHSIFVDKEETPSYWKPFPYEPFNQRQECYE